MSRGSSQAGADSSGSTASAVRATMLPMIARIRDDGQPATSRRCRCRIARPTSEPSFQSLTDPDCDCIRVTGRSRWRLIRSRAIAMRSRSSAARPTSWRSLPRRLLWCRAAPHPQPRRGARPRAPGSRYSPDMSRTRSSAPTRSCGSTTRRTLASCDERRTSDVAGQTERLQSIDAAWPDGIRGACGGARRARRVPGADVRRSCAGAGLLALTAPAEFGGVGLWSEGRYRPYYELLEALALIDSVTAQLLQVHSHALGIVAGLADEARRATLLPPIVSAGKLLASVGCPRRSRTGKLADIARTELEQLTRRRLPAQLPEVLRVGLPSAADELLIWTAVPGSGAYPDRSVCVLVPADAPEVELIDQWDVMGMRATVSHSVRIEGLRGPGRAGHRRAGGVDAPRSAARSRLRSRPTTSAPAGAALRVHRGTGFATGPGSPPPRSRGRRSGEMSSDLFARAHSALGRRPTAGIAGDYDGPSFESIRDAASRQEARARSHSDRVRRLRRPGGVPGRSSSSACTGTCAPSRCTTATSSTWCKSARRCSTASSTPRATRARRRSPNRAPDPRSPRPTGRFVRLFRTFRPAGAEVGDQQPHQRTS